MHNAWCGSAEGDAQSAKADLGQLPPQQRTLRIALEVVRAGCYTEVTVQSERDHSKIERTRALKARKRFQREKRRSQAAKKGWETRKADLGQFEKKRAAAVKALSKFVESGSASWRILALLRKRRHRHRKS